MVERMCYRRDNIGPMHLTTMGSAHADTADSLTEGLTRLGLKMRDVAPALDKLGMNTLVDTAKATAFRDGHIVISMDSGVEVRFPVSRNPRLTRGTADQLNNIEVSPFGPHWPDLDEDLSFRGLLAGDYGRSHT